jgi:hypothetical protein
MLGYDLQLSTVTQRPMAGHCEHSNMYLLAQNTINFFPLLHLIIPQRRWLRNCATNRKVAVCIPDGVIGNCRWNNTSGRNMTLGLTQPVSEKNTGNISFSV